MDPVIYIASSQLERPERHRTDVIEDFYHTHGHLPVWTRAAGVVAAVYRRLREPRRLMRAKTPGIGASPAGMVR